MTKEELLKMLQDAGMDDDSIKALLKDTLDTLDKDFEEHDADEEKMAAEDAAAAGKLLGVEL
jgi:hypothetical protein